METQEAELRTGTRLGEDRGEERVEELDSLTARHKDDELVLRKLCDNNMQRGCREDLLSTNQVAANLNHQNHRKLGEPMAPPPHPVHADHLAFVQYKSSQTHQSDLTGNHHHKLL